MKQLDLCGTWTFSKEGSKPTWRGNVPGCVHTDLLAAGEIEDPFYRDNEAGLQWITRENWVYERTFQMEDWSAFDRVLLRCEGLDTIATVTLNGAELGATDNQYRTWEFEGAAAGNSVPPLDTKVAMQFRLGLGTGADEFRHLAAVGDRGL
jgi:beta-mannosidase